MNIPVVILASLLALMPTSSGTALMPQLVPYVGQDLGDNGLLTITSSNVVTAEAQAQQFELVMVQVGFQGEIYDKNALPGQRPITLSTTMDLRLTLTDSYYASRNQLLSSQTLQGSNLYLLTGATVAEALAQVPNLNQGSSSVVKRSVRPPFQRGGAIRQISITGKDLRIITTADFPASVVYDLATGQQICTVELPGGQ